MKDFERYLKENGITNAADTPALIEGLKENEDLLVEMAMFVEQTAISPVLFGCTDCKTGKSKEYYITGDMLWKLLNEIHFEKNNGGC